MHEPVIIIFWTLVAWGFKDLRVPQAMYKICVNSRQTQKILNSLMIDTWKLNMMKCEIKCGCIWLISKRKNQIFSNKSSDWSRRCYLKICNRKKLSWVWRRGLFAWIENGYHLWRLEKYCSRWLMSTCACVRVHTLREAWWATGMRQDLLSLIWQQIMSKSLVSVRSWWAYCP